MRSADFVCLLPIQPAARLEVFAIYCKQLVDIVEHVETTVQACPSRLELVGTILHEVHIAVRTNARCLRTEPRSPTELLTKPRRSREARKPQSSRWTCHNMHIHAKYKYCIGLHCITLHCVALHCIAWYWIAMPCTAFYPDGL